MKNKADQKLFGEHIRKLRSKKFKTVKDFAKSLNMPATTIYNYESGQAFPQVKTLIKMAAILSVSVQYLLLPIDDGKARETYDRIFSSQSSNNLYTPHSNEKNLTVKEAELHVIDQIIKDTGATLMNHTIPVIGKVDSTFPVDPTAHRVIDLFVPTIKQFTDYGLIMAFVMDDDSMLPLINQEDLVIWKPKHVENITNANIVILADEKGDLTIRRVYKTKEITLIVSDNSKYDPIELDKSKYRIVGLVKSIWSIKTF